MAELMTIATPATPLMATALITALSTAGALVAAGKTDGFPLS